MSRHTPRVIDASLTLASPADARRGLIGFVSATIDGTLLIDGMTLRRTLDGRLSVSLPRRPGHSAPVVCPLTPEAMRSLELQILAALGWENAP